MIKRLIPILVLLGIFSMMACEQTNPFNTEPAYDVEANLKIDNIKIAAYLDTARIDSLYRIHDPSGVVIIVQKEGVGTRPTTNTVIYTDYIGYLFDRKIFDTSLENVAREADIFNDKLTYTPFQFVFNTGTVIQGWDIAFRRLRPGSKAIFVIPSPWGYRDREQNRIPANSVLIFKIDFLGID
jgi:FKBP-type peptidyl-prolyl cis-trans isomerase FkpA